jgi:hypothetical protein
MYELCIAFNAGLYVESFSEQTLSEHREKVSKNFRECKKSKKIFRTEINITKIKNIFKHPKIFKYSPVSHHQFFYFILSSPSPDKDPA